MPAKTSPTRPTAQRPTRPATPPATKTPPAKPADAPVDVSGFAGKAKRVAELPKATRGGGRTVENPLINDVKTAREAGHDAVFAYPVESLAQAERLKTLLYAAAKLLDTGMRVRFLPNAETPSEVRFATKEKSARQYTADDIRSWAATHGHATHGTGRNSGRIPAETRAAFKEAHGYS
jgi:hypothetical protein